MMRDTPEAMQQLEPPTSQQVIDQLSQLGVTAATQGFPEVSRAAMLRALCEDRRPDIVANAANACRVCWRFEEAQALMDEALAKAPNDGRFWATQGLLYLDLNRPQDAIDAFDKAFQFGSPTSFAKLGRAMALLSGMRLQEGLQAYESRFELNRPVPHPMPRWRGESLKNKVLLVEAEQGLGDSLMFSRFLDRVEGNYVFSVQSPLLGLFPNARRLGEEVRADYWIPLMSLPNVVGADISYRPIQPRRLMPLVTDSVINVGIFWKAKAGGNVGPQEERHGQQKSMPMETLLDLATIPNVRLHSLQFGESAKTAWGIVNEPPIHDFADMASYMAQMDLVVGVDTAPIHLAGMMNRPTVLMLNATGSWQWGTADRTPWYSSIRIFRQDKPGEWTSVVDKVKAFILENLTPRTETA
jgi:hypothetical protein